MIYIVEDDAGIRELVMYTLQNSGYRVCGFEQGDGLFSTLSDPFPELILLDIMLPGEDGIQILKKLRQDERTKAIPIIMLTAKSAEYDKVIGLDNGADDYVTKPFSFAELAARVRSVLSRTGPRTGSEPAAPDPALLQQGDLVVDLAAKRAWRGGTAIKLTPTEFKLLVALMRHAGDVLSPQALVSEVWGDQYANDIGYVRRYIWHLRQKLEIDPEHPRYIHNEHGYGYRFFPVEDVEGTGD